ncbi:MAG TPA: efflux RND transporter permease subunit [Tenuifilaceae bacterium]|nr:efflux RND transporter permease subunit [Tenuifilaceae bacterium]
MKKNFYFLYRNPISLVLAIIVLSGIYFYSYMHVSLFPEITFPKLKIIADNGEQPIDKMMITVTRPLENAIKQVPDLQVLRSSTSRGSCEISAFLNWNADINQSLQMLEMRINQVKGELPPEVQIDVERMNPSILPVMGYTLESTTKSPIELNLIANYIVKPFLSQISGVSKVGIIGGKTKEFWVVMQQDKMSRLHITPEIIDSAVHQSNFILANGYLNDYRRMYLSVTNSALHDKKDIEDVIIRNSGKDLIKLKDIANVEIREKVEYTRINANGKQALLVVILKQPNANLVDLAKEVVAKEKELKSLLPKGVRMKTYYNQADFVNDSIKSVSDSLWIGLLLAIIVAALFLRSLKASLTILITIPITILLTIMVLYGFGYTLNIMTLGAIAASIGLIIDDAIVIIEQIHREHEENHGLKTSILIHNAIKYLFPAMVGSSLSTIVIFLPFVLLSGVAGAYFKVLTNTMIVTLVCSFLVTWIGLPVIYSFIPNFTRKRNSAKFSDKEVKQQTWVNFFVRNSYISLIFILLLIGSIAYVLPRLQTGFLPEMDEGSIVLDYDSPPGTSLKETDRILREVEKIITSIPEVDAYSRRTGAQMGFFITEPSRGDYLIHLKKNRTKSTEEIIDELRKKIEATQPALRIDFGQVIGDMLGDLMESVQPIEIKIFGSDSKKLNILAKQVAAEIGNINGTADVFNGITIAGPSVEIVPDKQKLALFGISPKSLQYQIQLLEQGNIIGSIPEKEQYTNIRMIYPKSEQLSVEQLSQQSIFLPNGLLKQLQGFASIQVNPGVAEITRENLQPVAIVTARLNGRDLGGVMKEIKKQLNKTIALPNGYYISYGGAYAEQKQSFDELLMILATSFLLVFTIMLFLFRNYKDALIMIFIAILGVAGGLLALFITGTPLNVGSYTGLIMIIGIIGENAIFTFQQFSTSRKTTSNSNAITYAISTRLRPKLMTAIGAITALTPLALGIGTGAQMHQPLAIAVIGGFLTAIPLLLIVLPTLLGIVHKDSES